MQAFTLLGNCAWEINLPNWKQIEVNISAPIHVVVHFTASIFTCNYVRCDNILMFEYGHRGKLFSQFLTLSCWIWCKCPVNHVLQQSVFNIVAFYQLIASDSLVCVWWVSTFLALSVSCMWICNIHKHEEATISKQFQCFCFTYPLYWML